MVALTWRLLLSFLGSLLLTASAAYAQSTHLDSEGRFVLDLPDSYSSSSAPGQPVVQFEGEGPMIVVHSLPGKDGQETREEAFETGMETLRSSLPEATAEREPANVLVNGHPARWGVLKATSEYQGTDVVLFSFLGSVELSENTVYMFSVYAEQQRGQWEDPIIETFRTLRDEGEPVIPPGSEG